jgi:hypothetical protein
MKKRMRFDDKYTDTSYIVSSDNRLSVSLEEKKKKYIGHNEIRQRINVYHVDGGIIVTQQAKCDYAIHTAQTNNLYLIELKGSDYPHALGQILSTLDILLKQAGVSAEHVYARIVLSKVRVPNIRPAGETKLKEVLKLLKGSLKKQSQEIKENIN